MERGRQAPASYTRGEEEDLVVGVVNPTGRMMPYETSGKEKSQCRLPAAVALVEHGLVDVLYLPEANVDANGVRAVETYMTSVEDVEVVGRPRLRPLAPWNRW